MSARKQIDLVLYGQKITGLSFAVGECVDFNLTCEDPDTRNALDLSAGNVSMGITSLGVGAAPALPPLIPRQATITDAPNGKCTAPINSVDTVPTLTTPFQPGTYAIDIWRTDGAGNRTGTLGYGTIELTPAVMLPGQAVTPLPQQLPLALGPRGYPNKRGAWNSAIAYATGDGVTYPDPTGGVSDALSSFQCLTANTNIPPINNLGALDSHWDYIAQRGGDGQGAPGPAGLSFASVAALRAGAPPANATIAPLAGYYAVGDMPPRTLRYDAASTVADDGATTYKPTAVGAGAGRWRDDAIIKGRTFDVRKWGAKCDGVTDDTAAVQAAIAYTQTLTPKGGEIAIPGQCLIAGQLACHGTKGIRIVGTGEQVYTVVSPELPTSTLLFSSSGVGLPVNSAGFPSFIDARSTDGFEMDRLGIVQTNGAFTGLFVDLAHDNSLSDSTFAHFSRCSFNGGVFTGGRYQITARAAISFAAAIECVVEKCTFDRVLSGIRGQEESPDGTSIAYSNIITIRDCSFGRTPTAIMNPGQTWLVEACTFEGLQGLSTDYLHHAVNIDLKSTQYQAGLFTFRDNWCGDAFGDQIWIRLRDNYNTIIEANLFTGGVGGIQFYSVIGSSPGMGGITISHNSFSVSSFYIDFGAYQIGTHTGTGVGVITVSGNPSGAHTVVVRIDISGSASNNGGASWSYSIDGGGFVSVGAVNDATNLGGFGINVHLDGDQVSNSFIANDTYPFSTPSQILWNGCVIECNDLTGTSVIIAQPSVHDISFIGNRQFRPGGQPTSPNINGVWIRPALKPIDVPISGGGLLAWYKADALALSDGAPVAAWPDSSGHGWNLTQATAGFRPTFHLNGQNGLPIVRFDGADDRLISADMLMGVAGTVVMVATANGSRVGNDTMIDGNTNGANTMRIYRSGVYQMNLGGQLVGVSPQACAVYAMVATGQPDGSSAVRVGDFVVQGNLANFAANVHSIVVGMDGAGANPMAMDVAEIALFDRYLNPSEVVGVMNHLRAKWQCI